MDGRGLVVVISELSALLDTQLYDGISITNVHEWIDAGSVLRSLTELGGTDTDFSVVLESNVYGDFEDKYEAALQAVKGGYAGDERRKWGIENRGLCLLISWSADMLRDPETNWSKL